MLLLLLPSCVLVPLTFIVFLLFCGDEYIVVAVVEIVVVYACGCVGVVYYLNVVAVV